MFSGRIPLAEMGTFVDLLGSLSPYDADITVCIDDHRPSAYYILYIKVREVLYGTSCCTKVF